MLKLSQGGRKYYFESYGKPQRGQWFVNPAGVITNALFARATPAMIVRPKAQEPRPLQQWGMQVDPIAHNAALDAGQQAYVQGLAEAAQQYGQQPYFRVDLTRLGPPQNPDGDPQD